MGLLGWFSPLQALAEFSSDDSDNLLLISQEVFNINTDTSSIESYTKMIKEDTSNILKLYQSLGYTNYTAGQGTLKQDILVLRDYLAALSGFSQDILRGMGSASGTIWSGETIGSKLDRIITAIESLENSGGSGSEIPSDIATETTLTAFKGQYEQLSNQFLNSWGFSQELTLSNYLSNTFNPTQFTIYAPQIQQRGGAQYQEPFPGSTDRWGNLISQSYTFQSQGSFLVNLLLGLSNLEVKSREVDLYWRKKQAWNDWQAHTNMLAQIVAQVDRIVLPPEDGRKDSVFNPDTGTIETPSYGSSSAETVDIKPSYTNDFAIVEQSSQSVTNSYDFVSSEKIKQRYISDDMLSSGEFREYGSVGSSFSGSFGIDGFRVDLSQHFDEYRLLVPTKNLEMWRTAMDWIWKFLAVVAGFWFILKMAGISSSESSAA